MSYERQVFRSVGLGHQRPIFAAGQAMLDPRRVLVAGYADTQIEGAAAQPAEKDALVGQFAAVLTLPFLE